MNNLQLHTIIEQKIFFVRGQKVMLSQDLAILYGVAVKELIQAVKRNAKRFPDDFMYQLSRQEVIALRSQIVTLDKTGRGRYSKYLPYAFTEQGVAMLSSVLRSKQAVQVNIEIMRTFVRMRQILSANKDLSHRLDELEKKYDGQFKVVFEAIRQLMSTPPPALEKPKRKIGFHAAKN